MASPMCLDPSGSRDTGNPPHVSANAETQFRAESVVEADSVEEESGDDWDWDRQVSSITSSVFDYEYENGRRYHGYKAGAYPMPNDEKELDRLDLQHHVFTLALGGELYLAPLVKPKRVLDIGTGTGLWAILMADKHQHTNVLGVDLSPVQPDMVPENAHFEIDDIEAPWLYERNYFDYIHSRAMIGGISDWKKFLKQSLRHLKPGGWLELQELDPRVLSDDGTEQLSPYNVEFNSEMIRASRAYNKPVPHHTELKEMMEEAGFVDVQARFFKIPYNTWPRDARLKEIGKYQLINYYEGYEAIGIGLFTRVLGWTEKEFQVFIAKIRNELRDRNIHTYATFAVVYGRKPHATATNISRHTSPTSSSSSHVEQASLSSVVGRDRVLPPVPLFGAPTQRQPLQTLPEIMVAAGDNNAPTSSPQPAAPSRPRQVFPGSLTFRINRRGEVIRVRDGEDPKQTAEDENTVYQFTVKTGQLSLNDKTQSPTKGSNTRAPRRNTRDTPPAADAEQQAKLERLRRAQEEEARDPDFQPGIKPGSLSDRCLAPGMREQGGLHFTKESYAKILAK